MKNIHEVVRQKELAIERLKKEIETLRFVLPMLQDEKTTQTAQNSKPRSTPA